MVRWVTYTDGFARPLPGAATVLAMLDLLGCAWRAKGCDAMRIARVRILLVLMAVACGALIWTNTRGEADSGKGEISKGKILYVKNCAGCHGTEGKGDGYRLLGPEPANLTSPSTKKKSDSALLKTIHEGKPNMPSWKVRLSEQDSRDVLAYVRTLAK